MPRIARALDLRIEIAGLEWTVIGRHGR